MKYIFCFIFLLLASFANAFTIHSFDPTVVFYGTNPSQVATMDAAIGVTGFTVEDFEDVNLIPGLSLAYDGIPEANVVLSGDLDPRALWDGSKSLLTVMNLGSNTFRVAGGATSFGIGVGDVETSYLRLYVNDIDFGRISSLLNYRRTADDSREVYIRIDAGANELIHTVRFSGDAVGDGIFYDHVAVQFAVPEPGSMILYLAGLGMAIFFARKKKA